MIQIQEGDRVQKVRSQPTDGHQDGELATVRHVCRLDDPKDMDKFNKVLASVGAPPIDEDGVAGYMVEWDNIPRTLVFVAPHRVEKVHA